MKINLKKPVLWTLAGILLVAAVHWVVAQIQVRKDILWSQSDEYVMACRGTYNNALEELQEMAADLRQPWAVVMDVDDTCLSSSKYRNFKKRWRTLFYRPRWSDWCRKGEDPAVPGAAEFTRKVRGLGGKVVLITERDEDLRDATEKNLAEEGFVFDALLMDGPGRSKPLWREKVEEGSAVPGLVPLTIVLLVGDKKRDFFPEIEAEKYRDQWGRRFFLIPNPMTGDWLKF